MKKVPIPGKARETPPVLQRFLDKLKGVEDRGGGQYQACCPAHDDTNASLTVSWGDKGKVVFNCHAKCDSADILAKLDLTWKDMEQPRKIVAKYGYTDEEGTLLYQAVRYEPKGFSQRRPDGSGGWVHNMQGIEPVPFNLVALAEVVEHGTADDQIWIVEGEKDALAIATAWGTDTITATCNHGGAGKWFDAHSEHLIGFRGSFVIVADNDDKDTKPGQKHALSVYESLRSVAGIEAEIVYAPVGKDAADAVSDYGPDDFIAVTPDDLRQEIADAAASDTDERAEKVAAQVEWLRTQRDARALLAAEGWTPPPSQGSWAEQIEQGDEPLSWLISELAFEGANVVINAQAKSGKTSLMLNMIHSMLSGDALFGHFDVAALPEGRSVAWWNAELAERQAKTWLRAFTLPRAADFHPLHLRGYAMPFEVESVEDWAVEWLRERRVSVWVLDPLSALYMGEENSNTELGAWLSALDRIKRRAGVETAFIVHHVSETVAEESDNPNADRLLKGRGASRLTGWADVLWSYRGRFDEPRYLSALGRDVDVPMFGGLLMDTSTRLLSFTGQRSTPAQDRRRDLALKAYDAVASADGPLKAGELQETLPGRKPTPKRVAIDYAVELGWLVCEAGPQNSKLYSVGSVDPRRVKIGNVQRTSGEGDEQ